MSQCSGTPQSRDISACEKTRGVCTVPLGCRRCSSRLVLILLVSNNALISDNNGPEGTMVAVCGTGIFSRLRPLQSAFARRPAVRLRVMESVV